MNFTYDKNNSEGPDEFFEKIETIFKGKSSLFLSTMDDVCENIFEHDSTVNQIDITIRLIRDKAVVLFIDDGELYDPFNNEKFLESQSITKLKEIGCEFDYTNVLGFNKSYIKFNKLN